MDITSFSRGQISDGLKRAKFRQNSNEQTVRILFSPRQITDQNFDEVCKSYARIEKDDFDTVVIVESHPGSAEKKLPMPSFKSIQTKLGEVMANDKLRNDFCDEDDDFFIDDAAFDEELSLYDQLMMLQCSLDSFSVLSMQITDENSFIVKELAFALEEILASKNALLVICCDLEPSHKEEFENVISLNESDNLSGLMNYLNTGSSSIEGLGAFIAGLIVADKWGLKLHFESLADKTSSPHNLLTGFAVMHQKQPMYG
ncbi:MAG: AmmeMemoRadiSam system protein B [Balneolaceae bacterium]